MVFANWRIPPVHALRQHQSETVDTAAAAAVHATATGNAAHHSEFMQSLWPYHTYKPVTWDKYYAQDFSERQPTISSGVAAGVTIGIFFMVFIFTFGCRIYSQYVDRSNGTTSRTGDPRTPDSMMSESVAADLWICGVPTEPPPPYEIAIKMPTHNPNAAVTV